MGVGMSKFSASGERTPSHLPSRKNPGLDRISILGGVLEKRAVTFFMGEAVFTKKNKLKYKVFNDEKGL